ncbi:hypothetical protein MCAMS1_02827 [biofilm metagenome]
MAESTALEALIGEMLGDIGKLTQAVNALKGTLPEQVKEAENKLTVLINLLKQAGDKYQESVREYTQAQSEKIRGQINKEAEDARKQLQTEFNEMTKSFSVSIENRIARVLSKGLLKTALLCLASGLLAGLVIVYTVQTDQNQSYYAKLGKLTADAWPRLDAKTKGIIEGGKQ